MTVLGFFTGWFLLGLPFLLLFLALCAGGNPSGEGE